MAMTTSRNGILFVANREAIVLVAYPDGPNYSIGCGHNSPAIKVGDRITVKDALALLKRDLAERETRLNRELKQPVTQPQFDALMSLHYNTGNRFVWDVVRLINNGTLDEAAAFFATADRNLAGEHLAGLRKRRLLEQAIFVHGEYGPLDPILCWAGDPHATKPDLYRLQDGDI
jgi:lysozyme